MRTLRYLLGSRFRRDLLSLKRHRMEVAPNILFVAGSQVDLQWVIPAYEASVVRGLSCAFAGPGLAVPVGAQYIDVTVHLLRFVRARITVTSTTGLNRTHMPRSSIRRVAVPHSLVSLHMAYPKGTFDGYTDIFCCGAHHYTEIEAMNREKHMQERRPVRIGYGKLERLLMVRSDEKTCDKSIKHVLIGPSWGSGNILQAMGASLIRSLLADGYKVTLRPHPSFFTYGDALVAPLIKEFCRQRGFFLENSLEESRALWTADFMVTDYSGFAMEFAFVRELPVLYVDVPPKVLNPDWRSLKLEPIEISVRDRIGLTVPPIVDEVLLGLKQLEGDSKSWILRIQQERKSSWFNYGEFGDACAEELQRMLDEIQ